MRARLLKKAYAKRVDQARKELIDLKGVAYPEIDLAHIFNQLYVDARPQSSSSNQPEDWGQLISNGLSRLISQTCDGLSPYQGGASLSKKSRGCRDFISCLMLKQPFTNAEIDLMALRPYFDAIYLSSDAGICKPQPEFLKQVLDDHG